MTDACAVERRVVEQRVVALSTTSYHERDRGDEARAQAALESATALSARGIPLYVVDGHSSDAFRQALEERGALVRRQRGKGMGDARRELFRWGLESGAAVLAYFELEKTDYVRSLPHTVAQLEESGAQICVPRRHTLESYPPVQARAEELGNMLWSELVGVSLDMWFGPRTCTPQGLDYFAEYEGEYGDRWEGLFIPVLRAFHDGMQVVSADIDYSHEQAIADGETGNVEYSWKRIEQLYAIVASVREEAAKR